MKVGTDGVLLGAWTDVSNIKTILDVGTGTGVIALILAQRSDAKITGIEIEKNAAQEAMENASNSPWPQRIKIFHSSIQNFIKTKPGTFDLVVSNPPFFTNSQTSKNDQLSIAKHNHLLPVADMIFGSVQLLKPNGRLAIILPVFSAPEFVKTAKINGLFLTRSTEVLPHKLKKPHRMLMEFSRNKTETIKEFLQIHCDNENDFTPEYKNLTREFYLNF